jgi:hypothetical protein
MIQLKQRERPNHLREKMSDGNQGGPSLKDRLQVPDGPITRSRVKKIKEAMQGLVQSTWDEASKSPTIKVDAILNKHSLRPSKQYWITCPRKLKSEF